MSDIGGSAVDVGVSYACIVRQNEVEVALTLIFATFLRLHARMCVCSQDSAYPRLAP